MFMCSRNSLSAIWPILLAFPGWAVSQSICTENVTLSTAAEARSLRERCTVLDGSVKLPGNLSESINLDGIEEISGDFAIDFYSNKRYYGPLYEISSSTLKTVGSIDFGRGSRWLAYPKDYQALSLRNVSFPSLINSSAVQIAGPNLTHIDLTNLQYSNFFALTTPYLEELRLRGFKGQSIDYSNSFSLESIGNVESIDGLFSEPVDQTSITPSHWYEISFGRDIENYDSQTSGSYKDSAAPKLRSLTIGWEQIRFADFTDMNLTLTLGGTKTESMTIKSMGLYRGIYNLERGSNVKKLDVQTFIADQDFDNTDLVLPFDNVEWVNISGAHLRSVTLPQQAENWTRARFELHAPNLRLDNLTTWHWPLKFEYLTLEAGTITDDFFESFIQRKTKVLYGVQIVDHSKTLDCSKLYKKGHDRLSFSFQCEGGNDSNGALSIKPSSSIGLWICGLAVIILLW